MVLHHGWREQVEESLISVNGQPGVVVAAAQRDCGTGFEIDSRFYRSDVMPSEAGAVVGTQLSVNWQRCLKHKRETRYVL
jgi:hypothetical protein